MVDNSYGDSSFNNRGEDVDDSWGMVNENNRSVSAVIQKVFAGNMNEEYEILKNSINWDEDGEICCGICSFNAMSGEYESNEDEVIDEDECETPQFDPDDDVSGYVEDNQWCVKEARKAKGIKVDERPTQEEVDLHELTHLPFRSWCAHCVKGKAKGLPHHKSDSNSTIPVVSIDYTFMRDGKKEDDESGMPIMVLKDRETGKILSRVYPAKGVTNYTVKRLSSDIQLLGHKKVILKSDNENAIVALKKAVKNERPEDIQLEESPAYDSKSNGDAERAIQMVQDQIKTIKDDLETQYGVKISEDHQCLAWLVAHAGNTIDRYHVNKDGKTSFERWKGRPFKRAVAKFGENVIYLKAKSLGIDKFNIRLSEGIFLGVRDETSEIIIGTPDGVVKARDFRRKGSHSERWDISNFNEFRGVPWQPIPGVEDSELKVRVSMPLTGDISKPTEVKPYTPVSRRSRITEDDICQCGATLGCPGCIAINRGTSGVRGSPSHNDQCRRNVQEYWKRTNNPKYQSDEQLEEKENVKMHEMIKQDLQRIDEEQEETQPSSKRRRRAASVQEPDASMSTTRSHQVGGSSSSTSGNIKRVRPDGQEEEELRDGGATLVQAELDVNMDPEKDTAMNIVINSLRTIKKLSAIDTQSKWLCNIVFDLQDAAECKFQHGVKLRKFYDDITGVELNQQGVLAARDEEMVEVKKHNVYSKVPINQCWDRTGKKPIAVRWVDINKGDEKDPQLRSRIVAKDFNDRVRDDLFAATPPLEAIKLLLSIAVTEGVGFINGNIKGGLKLDFIDVRRAYYHAPSKREVYIDLPEGDQQDGMCGLLNKSLQGTRDAAQNWEAEYTEFLVNSGFKRGLASPCMFRHQRRNLRLVVHGDDFTLLGSTGDLDWFRTQIETRFEVKFRGRIGPEDSDDKSIKLLNRVIEWTPEGIRYEADQRHAEIIIESLGLRDNSKSVNTPGLNGQDENGGYILEGSEASMFRALAARGNYLSQDRSDIQFAVKELCRNMSCPTSDDWNKLKRLGRYLMGRERMIIMFNYQSWDGRVVIWTDSDWAGDKFNRKSTSGGVIMLGSHTIKSWASTQSVVALSSGEAEYYAIVNGSSKGMGVRSMLNDWDVQCSLNTKYSSEEITINTDSSAAKGICQRRGLGKVRHIEVNELWVQDHVLKGSIKVYKVPGTENSSDALTKYVDQAHIAFHLQATNQTIKTGRHELMPAVSMQGH